MLRAIAHKVQLGIQERHQLRNRLVIGAVSSFGLKIAGSGLSFGLSVILARCLGTVGWGIYAYAMTWTNLLSIPATLGIDQLIVREMAVYRARSRQKLMAGLLRWSNSLVLGTAIALALVAVAVVWRRDSHELVTAVVLAMTILPLASLRNLRLGAMRGLDRIVLGQIPDAVLAPLITIVLTSLVYFLLPDRLNVFWVLGIKIVATAITFIIGTLWLVRSLPPAVKQIKPQYRSRSWLVSALPFMFLGTVELINSRIDIIMLGGIEGAAAVGIYAAIAGIAQLTAFIHQASLGVLGPTIATLYSQGKIRQLEQLIQQSILAVFTASLLIGGTVIGFSNYLLLIFGSEFVTGSTAMNILIGGQIFNALTGPVGLVLNMTGHQRQTAIATASSAALNIVLNALLIPRWGIVGAAIATTASMVIINVIKVMLLQKILNISLYSFSFNKANLK